MRETRTQNRETLAKIERVIADTAKLKSAGHDARGAFAYALEQQGFDAATLRLVGNMLSDFAAEALQEMIRIDAEERFQEEQNAALQETEVQLPEYGRVPFQFN